MQPNLTGLFQPPAKESAILEALAAGGVELVYQPIIRQAAVPRITFFEGLARIRLNSGIVVLPGTFLPVLQAAGRIAQLDRFILRRALSMLQENALLRLSINVGMETITDTAWLNLLQREAMDRPMITDRLIVELTEQAVADPTLTVPFVRALHKRGVSVLLDDFGAGHTAFRQFRDLRLDGVKIDGYFSRNIEQDRDNQCLVSALVGIARHFEIFTVAEFVETPAQAQCLTDLGVDFLQGHLFAAAQPRPNWITRPPPIARVV